MLLGALCAPTFYFKSKKNCTLNSSIIPAHENVLVHKIDGITVVIRDKDDLNEKIAGFMTDGKSKLNIVTDFDFTITKFYQKNGARGYSTHKVLEACKLLPVTYRKDADALQQYYYPFEINPSLDEVTRIKYMEEWVEKAHNLLINSGLVKSDIVAAVNSSFDNGSIILRDNTVKMLELIEKNKIPLVIFSAGIKDVLEEIILHQLKDNGVSQLPPNFYILSNTFIFDNTVSDPKLVGFQEPLLHVFNKKATSFHSISPFFKRQDLLQRKNLLLIGDSLGDLTMSEGIPHDNIIKIGYLNDRPERLPQYVDAYDIVILGDPSMDVVLRILQFITGSE